MAALEGLVLVALVELQQVLAAVEALTTNLVSAVLAGQVTSVAAAAVAAALELATHLEQAE
jgi:hypothetical protein